MTVLRQPTSDPRAIPKAQRPKPPREVYYPESDGKPMAETDWHRKEMSDLIDMLDDRFKDRPNVYVAGNNFLYFVEGDARQVVSPDVYVVLGVPKRQRRVYKLWEDGVAPAVVFEVSSRKTRREDHGKKRAIYASLGVDEYFLCDPELDYLKPPLQGFALDRAAGEYRPMAPDAGGRLASTRLGLQLWMEGGRVQLEDAMTGERLLRPAELRERVDRERRAREAVERRAERERNAREAAERTADREHAARQVAEAELARLRAEIEQLRRESGG